MQSQVMPCPVTSAGERFETVCSSPIDFLNRSARWNIKSWLSQGSALNVDRFHSIHPTIGRVRVWKNRENRDRDDLEVFENIFLHRKLPEYIFFKEAGYEGLITLAFAKKVAIHFLQLNYSKGDLHFYRDCRDYIKYDNSVRCHVMLDGWRSGARIGFERQELPPSVVLRWQSHGQEAAVDLIKFFSEKLQPLSVAVPA